MIYRLQILCLITLNFGCWFVIYLAYLVYCT